MSSAPNVRRRSIDRRSLLAGSAALAALGPLFPRNLGVIAAKDATPVGSPTPPVTTASGPVTGIEHDGVMSFRGIPYATAPVGGLRWASPQPVDPWTEPLAADAFCSDCMQVVGPESIQTTPSEDCLYLNIWKPAELIADALLPVLVWIHGGGYVGGGASVPIYDGAPFARQDIVVVSFDYRLGRLGFFVPDALRDNTAPPFGNYGYEDQILALRWIHENISNFGGDPNRVTLMGESAGGASVVHLMTSPAVEDGLFQQAVILSGGGRLALLDRPLAADAFGEVSAVDVDNRFAASLGVVGNGPEQLARLRAVPAEKLVDDLDLEKLAKTRLLGGQLAGVPVVDGEIVQGQPVDHFSDGSAKTMPIIIGTTAIDVPTHFPPDKIFPLRWFGPDRDAAREAYGLGDDRFIGPAELITLLLSIGADMTMHEPAHFVASAMREAGHPAWVYRFTYTAESTRPAQTAQVHAGELPFLFDTLDARYGDAVTANDQATATAFHTYVANFVRTGDPNGTGLPTWPEVTPSQYEVMNFTLDDGPVFGPDPRPTVALVGAAQDRQRAADS